MNHKELILFFRMPVPFKILHLFSLFEQIEESFFEQMSIVFTDLLKKKVTHSDAIVALIKKFESQGINCNHESVARAVYFIDGYLLSEINYAAGHENVKQLQSVHLTDPDTAVATFFSNGKDALYAKVHPQS